jgi:hypothetical protein
MRIQLAPAFTMVLICAVVVQVRSQQLSLPGNTAVDPCGYPDTSGAAYKLAALGNWGYGYDSLLADITRWKNSPFVRLDSIGSSVQKRTLWMLTLQDTATPALPRKRVWFHARTHPAEVQGTWVTNEIIAALLSGSPSARTLLDSCVFNIVPMINPDGVELGLARQNKNGVDIESNWSVSPGEPEVQALRATFTRLMAEPNPIQIALNMHSSISCTRYFVYHAASGTSPLFASMQLQFIDLVRAHFPGGFQPWNYFVSWTGAPATVYPESWFWFNHREAVLALTYEDMNCASARAFDSTALALLSGIGRYLGVARVTGVAGTGPAIPSTIALEQNFPNPFNPATEIRFSVSPGPGGAAAAQFVTLRICDVLGREVATLVEGETRPGEYRVSFDAGGLAGGTYFYRLHTQNGSLTRKMLLVR